VTGWGRRESTRVWNIAFHRTEGAMLSGDVLHLRPSGTNVVDV
jgi:hypothetical protein